MIYKCKDCGKEYTHKPEFCDCGNNFFEIIKDNNDNIVENRKKVSPVHETNAALSTDKTKPPINYILWNTVIAVLVIIIAVLTCISIKNSKTQVADEVQKQEQQAIQEKKEEKADNINKPSQNIEVYIETPEINNEPKTPVVNNTQNTKPKETNTKPAPKQKETKNNTAAQVKQIQQPKPAQKPQSQQPNITKQNTTPQQPSKTTQAPLPAKKQETKVPPVTLPNNITSQPAPSAADKAIQKKELQEYKKALRNRISSDIDFTKVIGDGQCSITFKINSSGVLTNRAFSHQSDNDSLNDAVYSAVMNNPAYNPPPSGYKNEVMKLSVKIYGGRFEVDLN